MNYIIVVVAAAKKSR